MRLALLVTGRCNASCTHCTTDSSPHRTAALTEPQIVRLMDETAALREPGEPLEFCISGGEPFLNLPLLARVIAHGRSLGADTSCTTNGFWAASDDKARDTLTPLAHAGLRGLGISTSRFHQRFVPVRRVERALAAAKALGIATILKCAITRSDAEDGWPARLAAGAGADEVETFPVVPYLRDGARLPEHDYLRVPGLPAGGCPGSVLTVRENGAAYTCCNPGGFAKLLQVGDAARQPLREIAERHYTGGVQQILRRHGPEYFARYAASHGQAHRLRGEYAGVCDLCGHVAADATLARLARRAAAEYEQDQVKEVFAQLLPARAAKCKKTMPSTGGSLS